jgi:hypothetical protein
MRLNLENVKNKKQLESILLVCVLVATTMIVIFPLTAPKAKGITHGTSCFLEDGDPMFDFDGVPGQNGYVLWDANDDHIISDPAGYTIEAGMTLEIPNLNYWLGDPSENIIEFQGFGKRMDVYGNLITNPDAGGPPGWTCFTGTGLIGEGWDGIFLYDGSTANFRDVRINNSIMGVVMEPGSSLISPGIQNSRFENIKDTGLVMDGVTGVTNIGGMTNFYDIFSPTTTGTGLSVANMELNLSAVSFNSHGPNLPSLQIIDATVNADGPEFYGNNQIGNSVFVEGSASDATVLSNCVFANGVADNHYIRSDGASILIDNSSFNTLGGQLSVIANDFGGTADVLLRNPNPPGTTFDNSTINATGGSSVTLQWYKDVYVEDPDGNLIVNSPVQIKDRLDNPAQPSVKQTDVTGWARWIIVNEFTKYAASVRNFNPFNVSAENNSMLGYANPEETISESMVNTIVVPFNPVANTPPSVSYIALVPPGLQSGLVTIEFMLDDPDPGDDGNLSVLVEYFDPVGGSGWSSAVLHPSSDPTTNLNNNTLYTVIWVSNDPSQLPDFYDTGVDIRITPYDKAGAGTPNTVGPFTLDNKAPDFITVPTVDVTDTTAFINWTTDENAEARVFYGLTLASPVFTTEVIGSSGSTLQSVQLTGLQHGRSYTYIINSSDPQGNKRSSDPTTYTFKTEIHIQLYEGWNMVSIPPVILGMDVPDMLSSIAGQYDAVQVYDALDPGDPWKHYHPGKPSQFNDLVVLDDLHGFWILMKNDAILIPDHNDPTTDGGFPGSTPVDLVAGWNFVGYPSVTDSPLATLTGFTYDIVWAFDGGQWKYYDGTSGTLTQLEVGMGYWIHCPFPGTWNVAYV